MTTSPVESGTRHLELETVVNARHLGGLPVTGGRTTMYDVVRSASLRNLSAGGARALASLGVRTVFDLRTEEERGQSPEPDLSAFGIQQLWAPLVSRDPCPFGVNLEYGHAGFLWMYQNFLEHGRGTIVELVETLADNRGGLLYHCSAGEDRTGLVTAVLLSLAGVPESDIVADHAQSLSRAAVEARGHTGAAAMQRLTAPLNAMTELLQVIRTRWVDAEGYLLDAGGSRLAIDAFRTRAGVSTTKR